MGNVPIVRIADDQRDALLRPRQAQGIADVSRLLRSLN